MTAVVALYARISDDPDQTRAGVDRQLQDARAICERKGWTPAEQEYIDNDLSAYDRRVVRPAFEALLDDLSSGVLDGVVVYDLDRFMRQPRDLERAIDIFAARPNLVFASAQADLDLADPDGQFYARLMVNVANKSSADTSRRVTRKHRDQAERGVPVGGNRTFGWKDKYKLDPSEATIARAGAKRLLAGLSPYALATEWNAQGITTTKGNAWAGKTIKQYFLNPRLAGLRTYKGEVHLNAAGAPTVGLWEPMFSRDEFDQIELALRTPETRSRVPRKGAVQYLLSGIARCGLCNAPMFGSRRNENDYWYYTCSETPGHYLSVSGPSADSLIEEAILTKLIEARPVPVEAPTWTGEQRVGEITDQIAELMAAFRSGTLSSAVAFGTVSELEAEREHLLRERNGFLAAQATAPTTYTATAEDWAELHRDEKRAIISRFLAAVIMLPAERHSNRLDPARVVPVPLGAA